MSSTYTEPKVLLAQERQSIDFNVRNITYFLDGGRDQTELLERIMISIERNPIFQNDNCYDLSFEQLREKSARCMPHVLNMLNTARTPDERYKMGSMFRLADFSLSTRLGLHTGLFSNSLKTNGTPQQIEYWNKRGSSKNSKFFGCFAMTEMGHGSNVAGLETTATLDETTDEFVINTPNEAATKWWIGAAAHTANHCACFARLIVKGKDYGVKTFIVPLRNTEDHSLLPGIAIGDIGKKMGRDVIDNGWIKFSTVRIPRQFMLMRYCKVDKNGNVTQPPLQQLAYGPLIIGRAGIADDSFQTAKRFMTIAIRYAAVRRQFTSTPNGRENRLLDYVYHQRRLMPRLAYTYAMKSGSAQLLKNTEQAIQNLVSVEQSDKNAVSRVVLEIKEIFSASAGLKAFSSWGTQDIINECRQSCGGHGYSDYNGFGQGYTDWVVNCTWEGDNNVLTLSAGRSLIQTGLSIKNGRSIKTWATSYLNNYKRLQGLKLGNRDPATPNIILEAFESIASQAIMSTTDKFIDLQKSQGYNSTQAFEELSQNRFEIARVHTRLFLLRCFFQNIEENAEPAIQPILVELAVLFGLWSIENEFKLFLKYGYFMSQELDLITSKVNLYCHKVRQNAIGLTDAFNLSDFFIKAPIGSYDGDVYKHYFGKVTSRNPPRETKPPYYDRFHDFIFRKTEPKHNVSEMELDEELMREKIINR